MEETININFKTLYDEINLPVQVIGEDGKIVYANKSFVDLWEYNFDELKEYSVFNDPTLKRNGISKKIKNVFETGRLELVENYVDSLLSGKETVIPFIKTKIVKKDFDGKNFVLLLHEDQTEIKLAEEEIKKARDGNREAERLKNTFLNVLSHELRTPLNIILGYSSIIKENFKDKMSPEDKIYLDNLYSGSERLFNSITQMLEFAQIEAGEYKLEIEKVDIVKLLNSSLDTIKDEVESKGLDIKTNFKKDEIFVDVDFQCVENAVNNLLSNAVKYTKRGFIEVEAGVLKEKDIAICRIKDSGVGISSEYLDHLFRPFSQEELDIGRNYEGNGLGLALAKRYIEKLGGSLLVDSIKGVGSTFTFTLPLTATDENEKSSSADIKSDTKINLLMLDDSNDSFELINAFLKKTHSIDVHSFREFKFDLLENESYKAILFDVNQNRWDQSLIICKDLKNNDKHNRPVIIISSEYSNAKIKEFYDNGADKFLVKPFTKNDLTGALNEVIK